MISEVKGSLHTQKRTFYLSKRLVLTLKSKFSHLMFVFALFTVLVVLNIQLVGLFLMSKHMEAHFYTTLLMIQKMNKKIWWLLDLWLDWIISIHTYIHSKHSNNSKLIQVLDQLLKVWRNIQKSWFFKGCFIKWANKFICFWIRL